MGKNLRDFKPIDDAEFSTIIQEFTAGTAIKRILKERNIEIYDFFCALESNPERLLQYNSAQKYKVEGFADEISEIADTEENPAKARNRIDARRWYASKISPQKYGERLDINVNKTVDIRAAIAEGRSRIVMGHSNQESLPIRDLENSVQQEVIDIIGENVERSTGQEPVTQAISNIKGAQTIAAPKNDDDDIFS